MYVFLSKSVGDTLGELIGGRENGAVYILD